jgi:hypothetical protein
MHNHLHAKGGIGCLHGTERVARDLVDRVMNRSEYVVCAGRAMRLKVSMDFLKIG